MALEEHNDSRSTPLPVEETREQVSPEAARAQLDSILASESFRSSQRYSSLLRYIVSHSLAGDVGDLKERIVGIEVFGRAPDYDTGVDPTVRVAMNELRKRLAHYYSLPEHSHELRLEIPVGAYIVEFHSAPQVDAFFASDEQSAPPANLTAKRLRLPRTRILAAALVSLCAAVAAIFWMLQPRLTSDPMWRPLLSSSGPVLICLGASLQAGGNPPPVGSASGNPSQTGNTPSDEALRVGMIDIHSADDLAAFLRSQGKESVIHPTLGSDLSDTQFNAIVLFGRYLNEWNEQLHNDLRFRITTSSDGKERWIRDLRDPQDKSFSIQSGQANDWPDRDFALITRVQSDINKRWSLGIAGLTGQGTQAATKLLLDPKSLKVIEEKLPAGWEQKNLQIVLEVHVAKNVNGAVNILTYAVW